jgi:DNA adenine methylase
MSYQQRFFGESELNCVVNVASVPQRSPFRYPGGKTWLIPQIRRWLYRKQIKPVELIEPFAGGGIVGLTVAAEELAGRVLLVELDEEIAAVWQVILGDGGEWLANRIVKFRLTRESLHAELKKQGDSLRQMAFQTILKNRTYHGGILAPGSGALKNGENGKGILSRWYPETLRKRILEIQTYKERISFVRGDGIEVIRKNAKCKDVAFFIDPPYTAGGKRAGARLYKHFQLDHPSLFEEVSKISGDFLMTYDDALDVRRLAEKNNFDTELIAMTGTHHREMRELLIGKNLDWARSCSQTAHSVEENSFDLDSPAGALSRIQ